MADTFDELVARADSGDPRAACRLVRELAVCIDELPDLEASINHAAVAIQIDPDLVPEDGLPGLEHSLASAQARVERFDSVRAHCAGVPEVDMGRRLGWNQRAAAGGSRTALHGLYWGEGMTMRAMFSHSGHFTWLKRQLEPLAWRAMRAGDLESTVALMNALRPRPARERMDFLAQTTDVDADTALALALYVREAAPLATGHSARGERLESQAAEVAAQLQAGLTPSQQARARSRSDEWLRTTPLLPVGAPVLEMDRPEANFQAWERDRMAACDEPALGPLAR